MKRFKKKTPQITSSVMWFCCLSFFHINSVLYSYNSSPLPTYLTEIKSYVLIKVFQNLGLSPMEYRKVQYLEPCFFLSIPIIYVIVRVYKFILFSFFFWRRDIHYDTRTINAELKPVSEWFKANKLSL